MKYENFETVQGIIKLIHEHEETLDLINSKPIVIIKRQYGTETINFFTDEKEYDFDVYVKSFIENIRENIESRISNLKSQLEKL